jgi:hypothetical protein
MYTHVYTHTQTHTRHTQTITLALPVKLECICIYISTHLHGYLSTLDAFCITARALLGDAAARTHELALGAFLARIAFQLRAARKGILTHVLLHHHHRHLYRHNFDRGPCLTVARALAIFSGFECACNGPWKRTNWLGGRIRAEAFPLATRG